jgi:lupus La protein
LDFKSVEAFLNADPKPSWDGKELLIMSKEAYVEMKIKEKGLKGRAAVVKRDHITRKGFDAFREMRLAAGGKEGKKEPEKAPPEIFVSFLGKNLRVLDEDGGSVAPEDVPRVRGSALRFTGCGGEVSFDNIKRPLKERFSRAPFIKFTKGDDAGLVGFDKALDEEDVAFVKEKIPTLNGNPVTWGLPRGTSFPYVSCFMRWKTPFQRRKNTRLGLSGPTPRQSAL